MDEVLGVLNSNQINIATFPPDGIHAYVPSCGQVFMKMVKSMGILHLAVFNPF